MIMVDLTVRFSQIYPTLKKQGRIKTVFEFAESIGSQHSNYYKVIKGQRLITLPQVAALFKIYKISPDWLFLGEGEMFKSPKNDN